MRYLKAFIIISVFLPLMACKKDCCTIIDTDFSIVYKDSSGENIFQRNSAAWSTDEIKIYYKAGETFEYIYDSNMDAAGAFVISGLEDDLYITIYPSYHYDGNFSETLIELRPGYTDTVLAQFSRRDNDVRIQKIWYNGKEQEGRGFEIEVRE